MFRKIIIHSLPNYLPTRSNNVTMFLKLAATYSPTCAQWRLHCRSDEPHVCKVTQNFGRDKPAIAPPPVKC